MITDGENRALDTVGSLFTPLWIQVISITLLVSENVPLVEEMGAALSPEVLKILLLKGQTGGVFR